MRFKIHAFHLFWSKTLKLQMIANNSYPVMNCREGCIQHFFRTGTVKHLEAKWGFIGGESTPDLCFASPEEIPEWQRPRRATGNRRNHHCGDDSILRANITWDSGSPCMDAMGASVWGIGLPGCRLLCASKYIALLISSLNMSGAAPAPGSWGR